VLRGAPQETQGEEERDADLRLHQPVVGAFAAAAEVLVNGVLPARAQAQVELADAVVQVGAGLPGEHVHVAAAVGLHPADAGADAEGQVLGDRDGPARVEFDGGELQPGLVELVHRQLGAHHAGGRLHQAAVEGQLEAPGVAAAHVLRVHDAAGHRGDEGRA
jgi:hypothetical protein